MKLSVLLIAILCLLSACNMRYQARYSVRSSSYDWKTIDAYTIVSPNGNQVDPAPLSVQSTPLEINSVSIGTKTIAVDSRAVNSGLFIPARSASELSRVSFTVTEPSGIIRRRYPVRGSLPLFRGELFDPTQIRLFDEKGNEFAVQAKATAYWPEGSIKFLCIDFEITLGARQTKNFTLDYGSSVVSTIKTDLSFLQSGTAITVNTGVMSVTFAPGDRFTSSAVMVNGSPVTTDALFSELAVSENGDLATRTLYRLRIDKASVVESGPVQATIYLEGHFGNTKSRSPIAYQQAAYRYPFHGYVRLYEGTARMDVTYTFGYNGDEKLDLVRRYGLTIPIAGPRLVFGGDRGARKELSLAATETRLSQTAHNTWAIYNNAQTLSGSRFGGWASIAGSDSGNRVLVGLRNAWQQWPVSFTASLDEFRLDLHGSEAGHWLDLDYKGPGFNPLTENVVPAFHKSKSMYSGEKWSIAYGSAGAAGRAMGITKISEFVIDFSPSANVEEVGNAEHQQLIPWPGSQRFAETRVFGLIGNYGKSAKDATLNPSVSVTRDFYDVMIDYNFAVHYANGLFGWVDWGDLPDFDKPVAGSSVFDSSIFGGADGWSNGERILMSYLGHFIASGTRRAFDFGNSAVLHSIGMDTEHFGGDEALAVSHRHHQVHWAQGGEARQGGWVGFYANYWLTGNNEVLRSLEELHYAPFGFATTSLIAKYAWLPDYAPARSMEEADRMFLCGAECSPWHHMNLLRWITTGDKKYVRYFDLLTTFLQSNDPYAGGEGGAVPPPAEVGKYVSLSTGKFEIPLLAYNHDPMNPAIPVYEIYRFRTYGGDDMISEWAQLSGDSKAVDIILHYGDYHSYKGQPTFEQMYWAPEGIIPAYAVQRRASFPERVDRWRATVQTRLLNDPIWSSMRMTPGSKPRSDLFSYTAANFTSTKVPVFGPTGSNTTKISLGHGMEALYTLWMLQN